MNGIATLPDFDAFIIDTDQIFNNHPKNISQYTLHVFRKMLDHHKKVFIYTSHKENFLNFTHSTDILEKNDLANLYIDPHKCLVLSKGHHNDFLFNLGSTVISTEPTDCQKVSYISQNERFDTIASFIDYVLIRGF